MDIRGLGGDLVVPDVPVALAREEHNIGVAVVEREDHPRRTVNRVGAEGLA